MFHSKSYQKLSILRATTFGDESEHTRKATVSSAPPLGRQQSKAAIAPEYLKPSPHTADYGKSSSHYNEPPKAVNYLHDKVGHGDNHRTHLNPTQEYTKHPSPTKSPQQAIKPTGRNQIHSCTHIKL